MTTDDLDTKTDLQLTEIFAAEVACVEQYPSYATNANAVLPWLEKHRYLRILFCQETPPRWEVMTEASPTVYAIAVTFPRAAAIALVRAKRAT